jgi:putative transposase
VARKRRVCPPGLPVHVVQRGNNRQVFFAETADLKAYANWLHDAAEKYDVKVHAWVFMTNHVHLLLTAATPNGISRCMQFMGRHYVRRFNYRYKRTGTLFEGRFKSSIVQTREYFLACQRYIELNPVRAGIVKDPIDYSWSSYGAHAFGTAVCLWTPHAEYLALATTPLRRQAIYRELIQNQLRQEIVNDIRVALNKGLVLGTDRFKEQVEQLTGQ